MKAVLVAVVAAGAGALAGWFGGVHLAELAVEGRLFTSAQINDYGSWQSSQALGAADGDPILIAWIARTGILPLARSEVAYFFTDKDSEQRPLDPDCEYRVSVPATDARWWSVTVYDEARKPIANRLDRYSFNSDSGISTFTMARSAPADEAAWLPLGESRGIELLFRVYQPGPGFDPAAEGAMPSVQRSGACSG